MVKDIHIVKNTVLAGLLRKLLVLLWPTIQFKAWGELLNHIDKYCTLYLLNIQDTVYVTRIYEFNVDT